MLNYLFSQLRRIRIANEAKHRSLREYMHFGVESPPVKVIFGILWSVMCDHEHGRFECVALIVNKMCGETWAEHMENGTEK